MGNENPRRISTKEKRTALLRRTRYDGVHACCRKSPEYSLGKDYSMPKYLNNIEIWNRWMHMYGDRLDVNLSGTSFQHKNLNGANLSRANLSGCSFRGCWLEDANLKYADLGSAEIQYTNFDRANIRAANLRMAKISNSSFIKADLSSADVWGMICSNTDLRYVRNLGNVNETPFAIFYGNLIDPKNKGIIDEKRSNPKECKRMFTVRLWKIK